MKQFIIDLVQLIPFALMAFFWGLDDGKEKKTDTQPHWPKFIIAGCFVFICYYFMMIGYNSHHLDEALLSGGMTGLGWFIIWKPLFDKGWTKGRGLYGIYLGSTSKIDVAFNKVFGKFIPMVYLFMIFIGLMIMIRFKI